MADGTIFGLTAIQQAVQRTLIESAIPDDHQFAAVASFDPAGKVLTTTIAAKVGENWRVDGTIKHGFERMAGTSFGVMATWK